MEDPKEKLRNQLKYLSDLLTKLLQSQVPFAEINLPILVWWFQNQSNKFEDDNDEPILVVKAWLNKLTLISGILIRLLFLQGQNEANLIVVQQSLLSVIISADYVQSRSQFIGQEIVNRTALGMTIRSTLNYLRQIQGLAKHLRVSKSMFKQLKQAVQSAESLNLQKVNQLQTYTLSLQQEHQKQIENKDIQLDQLRNDIQYQVNERKSIQTQMNQLFLKITHKQSQIERLLQLDKQKKLQMKNQKAQNSRIIYDLQRQVSQHSILALNFKLDLQKSNAQLSQASKRQETLNTQFKQQQQHISLIEKFRSEAQNTIKQLLIEIQNANKQNQKLARLLDQENLKSNEYRRHIRSLRQQISDGKNIRQHLIKKNQEMQTKLKQLAFKNDNILLENEQLAKKVTQSNTELTKVKHEILKVNQFTKTLNDRLIFKDQQIKRAVQAKGDTDIAYLARQRQFLLEKLKNAKQRQINLILRESLQSQLKSMKKQNFKKDSGNQRKFNALDEKIESIRQNVDDKIKAVRKKTLGGARFATSNIQYLNQQVFRLKEQDDNLNQEIHKIQEKMRIQALMAIPSQRLKLMTQNSIKALFG